MILFYIHTFKRKVQNYRRFRYLAPVNTSRNRGITFRPIEFKASRAIKFDDYAACQVNQLNSSEELYSSETCYTSFGNFELKGACSL